MNITLTTTDDPDVIRAKVHKYSKRIRTRQAEIKILQKAIDHYQRQCDHPGQKTGSNERDGDWANECPVCGESH